VSFVLLSLRDFARLDRSTAIAASRRPDGPTPRRDGPASPRIRKQAAITPSPLQQALLLRRASHVHCTDPPMLVLVATIRRFDDSMNSGLKQQTARAPAAL
jgi:hypothetical protein